MFFEYIFQELYSGVDYANEDVPDPSQPSDIDIVIQACWQGPHWYAPENGYRVNKTANPHQKSIFFCGEFGGYDNSLVEKFAPDLFVHDNIDVALRPDNLPTYYVPLYISSFFERKQNTWNDLIKPSNEKELDIWARNILKSKTKFMAYQHGNCVPLREHVFDLISEYKQVDGLGKCKRNVNTTDTRPPGSSNLKPHYSFHDDAVDRYSAYKFVLAFENHANSWYQSEKLMNVLLANAIPIYYGAHDIHESFSEHSFVHANRFMNFHEMVEYIIELDQDDEKYIQVLKQPWLHNNKLSKWFPHPATPDNYIFQQFRQLKATLYPNGSVNQ
jgi:hypothetical protein